MVNWYFIGFQWWLINFHWVWYIWCDLWIVFMYFWLKNFNRYRWKLVLIARRQATCMLWALGSPRSIIIDFGLILNHEWISLSERGMKKHTIGISATEFVGLDGRNRFCSPNWWLGPGGSWTICWVISVDGWTAWLLCSVVRAALLSNRAGPSRRWFSASLYIWQWRVWLAKPLAFLATNPQRHVFSRRDMALSTVRQGAMSSAHHKS